MTSEPNFWNRILDEVEDTVVKTVQPLNNRIRNIPIAKFIRELPREGNPFHAVAHLYWCEIGHLPEYVVVSTAVVFGEPETYIFAADAEGNITSWNQLDGSFKGKCDHIQALMYAGYATI